MHALDEHPQNIDVPNAVLYVVEVGDINPISDVNASSSSMVAEAQALKLELEQQV